jgi:carbon starvation protein
MLRGEQSWAWQQTHLLFAIGVGTLALQAWMIVEGLLIWPKVKGVMEEPLPPLTNKPVIATTESMPC